MTAPDLRSFLASGGVAPAAFSVQELRQERAKRAAEDLLGKLRQRPVSVPGQGA